MSDTLLDAVTPKPCGKSDSVRIGRNSSQGCEQNQAAVTPEPDCDCSPCRMLAAAKFVALVDALVRASRDEVSADKTGTIGQRAKAFPHSTTTGDT